MLENRWLSLEVSSLADGKMLRNLRKLLDALTVLW